MKIDANFEPKEVIIQNPDKPCPATILHSLGLLSIEYISFDKELHQGQIIMATEVIAEVEAFFKHSVEQKFPIERVVPVSASQYRWDDKKILADNVSAGFDYRPILNKNKMSYHSQGLAFDINPRQNPYIRYDQGTEPLVIPEKASWNPLLSGTLHANHPLVKLMEGFGWEWGGHWTPESGRTDYQHFQKTIKSPD